MEEGLVTRLVQAGIRTMNPHQQEQVERFGAEVIEAWNWHLVHGLEFQGPLYLSVDLDVLDPAYAPGVSHHEPGGVTSRDLLELIKRIPAEIVGADIVEYNPERDSRGVTASLAAKLTKELVGRMLDSTLGAEG
jgi:arginase family enzyme